MESLHVPRKVDASFWREIMAESKLTLAFDDVGKEQSRMPLLAVTPQ